MGSSISEYGRKQSIIPSDAVIQFVILLVCIVALYLPLVSESWYMGIPGFIVPLPSIYSIWLRRHDLREARRSPEIWGLVIVFMGGSLLLLNKVISGPFIGPFIVYASFAVTITGLILYILGWEYLILLGSPLLSLFLMVLFFMVLSFTISAPSFLSRFVVHRLQFISTYFTALLLSIFNVPLVHDGNLIYLPGATVHVEEACAGMRYVFSTMMLTVLIAYLTQRTWIARLLYMIAAIMVAVAVNAMRVASATAMIYFISVELALGFYHKVHSSIMYVLGYGGLIGTAILFSRIFGKRQGDVETQVPPNLRFDRQVLFSVLILACLVILVHFPLSALI